MPLVAIVGRPNVGKSTLFNRICGKRRAIESPIAGTTRDSIFIDFESQKIDFTLVDTGGIFFVDKKNKQLNNIENDVQSQAKIALQDADLILFCLNIKEEITETDKEIIKLLIRKGKKNGKNIPVFFVGTKVDRPLTELEVLDYYQLGFEKEEMFFVSAIHNYNIQLLIKSIENNLIKRGFMTNADQLSKTTKEEKISLAFLGRPNAGKSSLVNAFLGKNKIIVSDIPGTTRDSIHTEVKYHGENFKLIDTAGIRRRKNREKGIEHYSFLRSIKALKSTDIVVILIDSSEGVTHQDQIIMHEILEAKTGLIIAVTKWDDDDQGRFFMKNEKGEEKIDARDSFIHHLQDRFGFISWAPVVFVSAKKSKNLTKVFDLAKEIYKERTKKISTPIVNQFLEEIFMKHSLKPIAKSRIMPKIKFGTQVGTKPPHFIFFANNPDAIHFSSQRFIENQIRGTFGFRGTGLVIEYRRK